MATLGELKRPGIEVLYQFQAQAPTVITPTLRATVVGPCWQIVEVLETSAAGAAQLNEEAKVSCPAMFSVTGLSFVGLTGLSLGLSVNNSPVMSVTFAAASLSNRQVVDAINAALVTNKLWEFAYAETTTAGWRFRTRATGQFQQIAVSAPAYTDRPVLTAFALPEGHVYYGYGYYAQKAGVIPWIGYPDPRSNLDELAVDYDASRLFYYLGTGVYLQEAYKTQALLRYGITTGAGDVTAIAPQDDGDGDSMTPIVRFTGEDFTVDGAVIALAGTADLRGPARIVGTVDLGTLTYDPVGGGDLDGLTLIVTLDGGAPATVTFPSAPAGLADEAAVITEINTQLGVLAASQTTDGYLAIASVGAGPTTSVDIGAGTSNLVLGFAADPAVVNGGVFDPTSLNGLTVTLDDGTGEQTFTFSRVAAYTGGGVITTDIVTQLEGAWGSAVGGRLSFDINVTTGLLTITTDQKGSDAYLRVVSGTALVTLGHTAAEHRADYSGTAATPRLFPYRPLAGDDVYINGTYIGRILQVAPGGTVTDLKLDQEVLVTLPVGTTWTSYYIVANNLPGAPGVVRPTPDLVVATDGALTYKHNLVRDTQGTPITANLDTYVYYKALRLDVSPAAADPAIVRVESDTMISSLLEPIDESNPLALGGYLAWLNGNNTSIDLLGVSAISDDQPQGTTAAYSSCFDFLEAQEEYAIAPLTSDYEVAVLLNEHVDFMSEPESKGERIGIFALPFPTRGADTAIASGANGNTDGSSPRKFDTGVANLATLLLAAGVSPVGTIAVDEGVFLDIETDAKHYSVSAVSGSMLTLRDDASDFAAGENDDLFYSITEIPQCIAETFSLNIRGELLVLVGTTTPDKDAMAEAYVDFAQKFANRRFWHMALNTVTAPVNGISRVLPSYYWCAAYAGAVGGQPPQQSFTNLPLVPFTAVTGTSGYFSNRQLNIIAGGGNTIPIQDTPNGSVFPRMALTTDMTSIETRTDSITKVLDYTGKFFRTGLRNFIGKFNITQNYLDTLSQVLSGLKEFLVAAQVLMAADIQSVEQDASAPDTVSVTIDVDPPYPANYIRIKVLV